MGYYQEPAEDPQSNRRLIRWLAIVTSIAALLSCIAVVAILLRSLEVPDDGADLDILISQITTQTALAKLELAVPNTEPPPSATPVLAGVATATSQVDTVQIAPTRLNTQVATATVTPFAQDPTATPFVPPTRTVAPTATNTPSTAPTAQVAIAPGTNYTLGVENSDKLPVHAAQVGITIDGSFSEWPGNITGVSSPFQVAGEQRPVNKTDIGVAWYPLWDSSYLYFKIVVIDDVSVQINNNNEIYNGDSIELEFDLNLDGDRNTPSNDDDYMIIITAGDFGSIGPKAQRYQGAFTGDNAKEFGHNIFVIGSKTIEGYNIELAIPWSDLGGVPPTAGQTIGLALSVNDTDTVGSNVVETVLSNTSDRERRQPKTWGDLIFHP